MSKLTFFICLPFWLLTLYCIVDMIANFRLTRFTFCAVLGHKFRQGVCQRCVYCPILDDPRPRG